MYLFSEDYSCIIDLAFIVDASGSVADDWNILLQFVENVAKRVNMGPQRTHIAIVRFGDDSEKVFDFREFNETPYKEYTILNKITSIPKPRVGERTFINRGLRRANREVFRANFGMRPNVQKVSGGAVMIAIVNCNLFTHRAHIIKMIITMTMTRVIIMMMIMIKYNAKEDGNNNNNNNNMVKK